MWHEISFGTFVLGPDARPAAVPKAAGATRPKRSASSKSGKGSKSEWGDVGEPWQIPWQIPSMWVIFLKKTQGFVGGLDEEGKLGRMMSIYTIYIYKYRKVSDISMGCCCCFVFDDMVLEVTMCNYNC